MPDYRIIHDDELMHYGIPGMRWGHRKREAKKSYRDATNKAFSKYEKGILDIEKGYKRGQMLSKEDLARESKVESDYQKSVSKAKSDYKQAKAKIKADKKEYKKDVKSLRKTFGIGDVNLYNDQGLMIGRVNATMAAHNELVSKKGKDYADKALKTARNQSVATIAASAAVMVGASVCSVYLDD